MGTWIHYSCLMHLYPRLKVCFALDSFHEYWYLSFNMKDWAPSVVTFSIFLALYYGYDCRIPFLNLQFGWCPSTILGSKQCCHNLKCSLTDSEYKDLRVLQFMHWKVLPASLRSSVCQQYGDQSWNQPVNILILLFCMAPSWGHNDTHVQFLWHSHGAMIHSVMRHGQIVCNSLQLSNILTNVISVDVATF